jgi:multiple sugar transport system permease protein
MIARAAPAPRRRRRRRGPEVRAALLSLPALLVFLGFSVLPLLTVLRYATWRWSGTTEPVPVGAENLLRLLRDEALWSSLGTTALFAVIAVPAFIGLSVAIALALEGLRFERAIKALLFAPGLVTVAASAIAWYLLYNPDFGVVVELTGLALPWTSHPWAALGYVILFTLWHQTGYGVLVASAALRGIPREVKEAARVDGASEAEVRRLVVLPLLRPTVLFLTVVGTVIALQSYTAVFLLTRGGPFGSTRVIGYYLYETAFERFELGYGAAITVFVMVVTLTVAGLQAWTLARRRAGGVTA